jgi:hypothetical protein
MSGAVVRQDIQILKYFNVKSIQELNSHKAKCFNFQGMYIMRLIVFDFLKPEPNGYHEVRRN